MSFARIQERFIRLPRYQKLISGGALFLAISAFLPWYADLDSYNIGAQYYGVTGPTALIGVSILLLSAVSLWLFSYHLFERHVPRLPFREGVAQLFVAVESFFLLVVVNSIFFHSKFGYSTTFKESRFGMVIAFIGVALLFIGAYMLNKFELLQKNGDGKLEPLIKLEPAGSQQRAHSGMRPERATAETRSFLFGEKSEHEEPSRHGAADKPESQSSGSYKIRMDL